MDRKAARLDNQGMDHKATRPGNQEVDHRMVCQPRGVPQRCTHRQPTTKGRTIRRRILETNGWATGSYWDLRVCSEMRAESPDRPTHPCAPTPLAVATQPPRFEWTKICVSGSFKQNLTSRKNKFSFFRVGPCPAFIIMEWIDKVLYGYIKPMSSMAVRRNSNDSVDV